MALNDISDIKKCLVLAVTTWGEYIRLKDELAKQGLKEFDNFFYWEAYIKKIAVVHANCYGSAYMEFLKKSQDFAGEYFLYPLPAIHTNMAGRLDEALLKNCDLFIHQDIRKDNRYGYYFSDEYILPRLNKDCKRLVVPNLVPFTEVIFPKSFVTGAPRINLHGATQDVLFAGNRILDEAFQSGKDLEGIMAEFLDVNIVSEKEKQQVRDHFDEKMESLRKREEKWDVKIRDYILENYQEYKLFTDLSHPSLKLMSEICRRIGKTLGLRDILEIQLDNDYEMVEMYVMPWVKDALGLKFSEKYVRSNNRLNLPNRNKLGDGRMGLREYIREYVYWKFGKFLD